MTKTNPQEDPKKAELLQLISSFCRDHLDEEYETLCQKMITKLSRKRQVPYSSGRLEIWAAAVIQAIGTVNFLFDRSFQPYVSTAQISDYFGTSTSTVGQKAKLIRDMFKMRHWDNEFSTQKMNKDNPFTNLASIFMTIQRR